jgi:DNA-binding Lrp family transcriptional regulator
MSDGITDSNKLDQQHIQAWKNKEIKKFLSRISTKEILIELENRSVGENLEFCKQLVSQCRGIQRYSILLFMEEKEG